MRGMLVVGFVAIAVACAPASADASFDLQAAIDATPSGGRLELASGRYEGSVTVDRPMTITGPRDAVVDGGGNGSVFTITAPDVTIDGLTIRGSGDSLDREHSGVTSVDAARITVTNNVFEDVLFGVFLRTAPGSVVADNVIGAKQIDVARRGDGIRLWESEGSIVERNIVTGGRDLVFWFTDRVEVRDNQVRDGRYGLHFMYSDDAVVEGNELSSNSVGAFLMYSRRTVVRNNVMSHNYGPSGYGVGLKEIDDVRMDGNRMVANRVGIYLDNSPSAMGSTGLISGNLIAYNRVGVLFLPNVRSNIVTGNTFIDNDEQVGVTGTGVFQGNAWDADGEGNFWSDYAGFDADGDGVGDVVYRVNDLYDTITDRYPDLAFFSETPAAKAIDVAASMFPVLRPDPLVEDPHPLVDRPPLVPVRAMSDTGSSPVMGAVALGMLAAGLAVVAAPVVRARRVRRSVSA